MKRFELTYFTAICIGLFFALYFVATKFYPGGTSKNHTSEGFDWVNNYWCDLLSDTAYNGQPNDARPYAFAAMIILGIGIVYLAFNFNRWLPNVPKWVNFAVKLGAVVSMLVLLFLATDFHGYVLIVSGLFGLMGLIGIIYALKFNGYRALSNIGVISILILILNNVMYFAKIGIDYLPLVQKISFLIVLCWIAWLSVVIERDSLNRYHSR